ncbi:hypothetical protein BD626DRAFT_574159 [Schizophyllum amplum]|uniref:Uncharacterized protein n=1 Tax=Schizophyllum amplum TaxID=97359 RepID=A0A550BZ58_9AGAR|nr:hypothetical protein BD626DRAFT_574159 [Auriculariopsis ampla]
MSLTSSTPRTSTPFIPYPPTPTASTRPLSRRVDFSPRVPNVDSAVEAPTVDPPGNQSRPTRFDNSLAPPSPTHSRRLRLLPRPASPTPSTGFDSLAHSRGFDYRRLRHNLDGRWTSTTTSISASTPHTLPAGFGLDLDHGRRRLLDHRRRRLLDHRRRRFLDHGASTSTSRAASPRRPRPRAAVDDLDLSFDVHEDDHGFRLSTAGGFDEGEDNSEDVYKHSL